MIAIRTSRRHSPLEIWRNVDRRQPANVERCRELGISNLWLTPPWLRGTNRFYDLVGVAAGSLTNMDLATAWRTSERGPVLVFDGSNDRVDTAVLSTTGPMTYAARIRVTNTSTHCIFGWSSSSSIAFRATGTSLQLANGFSAVGTASSVLTTGTWCNVGARYTPGSNSWGIYLNGRLVASGTAGATLVSTATLTIGLNAFAGFQPFQGDIHHAIYCSGRAWSDHEFAEHHIQSLIGTPGLLNHERRRSYFLPQALTDYTLTADHVAYEITGQAATLRRGYRLSADFAGFSLSGQAAVLLASRRLPAAPQAVAISDQPAGLLAARRVSGDHASLSLTGQAANVLAARSLNAQQGSVTITGQNAALVGPGTSQRSIFRASNFRARNFSKN